MTQMAITTKWLGFAPTAGDRALSDEAKWLRRNPWQAAHQVFSLSVEEPNRRVAEAIIEAAQEAGRPNWDGQGGLPITQGGVAQAFAFLNVLPSTLPGPDISVDPDGEISFEWSFGPRRTLTASIDASGRISFAALIGAKRLHGTDYLLDALPEPLTLALRQLHASAA